MAILSDLQKNLAIYPMVCVNIRVYSIDTFGGDGI